MTEANLSELCSLAIVDKDIEVLQYLIDVCNQLHAGVENVDGFNKDELPTDEKYEEMRTTVKNHIRVSLLNIASEDISNINKKYIRKPGLMSNNVNTLGIKKTHVESPDSILVIDGIQVQEHIDNIENAILMKKYDGCSIACIFARCGLIFKLEYARTRGIEKNSGRQASDATTKMKLMVNDFEDSFNEFISKNKILKFYSKDFSKKGNVNEPIETSINSIDIDKITIRGELVLKNKLLDKPNCSAVAGPLNGKYQTFKDKSNEFVWKPFEIINIVLKDKTVIIPCQKDALEMLIALNQYNPDDFIEVENLNNRFDFLGLLNTWINTTEIPLDGIVYCSSYFTYPSCSEESSKRVNYGKYKFKKNNTFTTKILGFNFEIGATGKYTCIATVDMILANGKRYEKIRLPFRKIEAAIDEANNDKSLKTFNSESSKTNKNTALDIDFDEANENEALRDEASKTNKNFGINTVIEATLSRDIMLTFSKSLFNISKDVIPFEFPKQCIYCNHDLELRRNKDDTVLACINPKCKGILMKRLEKFLSEIGMKGISETIIFKYFKDKEFNFKDFYRDVINVPLKNTTRRTGSTTIERGVKYNYDEIMSKMTNEKLLIAFQLATQSTLKNKMSEYGLRWNKLDIASLRRINDELVKEVL